MPATIANRALPLAGLIWLATPRAAAADVITPLDYAAVPLLLLIVLAEAWVFWLLAGKWLKTTLGFWRLVVVTLVANLMTSLLGLVAAGYLGLILAGPVTIGLALLCSILVEWAVYLPFMARSRLGSRNLFVISLVANLVSYVLLGLFAVLGAGYI